MIGTSRILAVIPARGGSKRFPGKNIAQFRGKPLVAHAIEAARRSAYIDRAIVSTDDPEIALVSERWGGEVPFLRPAHLATDGVTTSPVIMHAVAFLAERGEEFDFVVTLQPMSPLRTSEHVDQAIELLEAASFDAVMSVTRAAFSPYWMVKVAGDRAVRFVDDGVDYFNMKERRELPVVYQPNGAVYVTRVRSLFQERAVISRNCGVTIMDETVSVDVDSEEDLRKLEQNGNGSDPARGRGTSARNLDIDRAR